MILALVIAVGLALIIALPFFLLWWGCDPGMIYVSINAASMVIVPVLILVVGAAGLAAEWIFSKKKES